MNKRAAELPMNTIIIVVLVVIVLVAVGLFFFMQFSKGGAVISDTSKKSAEGGTQLNNTVNWTKFQNALTQGYVTDFDIVVCSSAACAGT
jgi:flagellar basal body-associated protein FliL